MFAHLPQRSRHFTFSTIDKGVHQNSYLLCYTPFTTLVQRTETITNNSRVTVEIIIHNSNLQLDLHDLFIHRLPQDICLSRKDSSLELFSQGQT